MKIINVRVNNTSTSNREQWQWQWCWLASRLTEHAEKKRRETWNLQSQQIHASIERISVFSCAVPTRVGAAII